VRLPVRPLPLAALLVALPVAFGVLPGAAAAPAGGKPPVTSAASPRVVVADVDSGINPYHQFFQRGKGSSVTPDVLKEFGIGEGQIIDLTSIDNVAQDFARVERGTPYWFRGTNLIGISFTTPREGKTLIFGDKGDEHGTGTAASVLGANPEAIVVMVEGINDESETFAFTHPAVDIVTTSYGIPGSLPVPFHLENSYEGSVKRGKMHFGASDNSPALSPPDGTSGPWWTIAVAGFHEDTTGGRETLSGNVIDFVGDFTQNLPYCSDCTDKTRDVSGTSFATPRSAGTASKVLLEARRAAGHVGGPLVKDGVGSLMVQGRGTGKDLSLTPWQLRRALEEAAHYPGIDDYKGLGTRHTPVLDQAPYLQTGWGILSPAAEYGVVDQALAQLGVRGEPREAKGGAACDFNHDQHDLRHVYWDNLAIGSESFFTTDEDPFLHC
jgi:hypothetical protein